MKPRLTFVIPSFNAETTISDTIYSVPKRDDVEIIIVDDGSKDATPDIIKSLADEFPENIKYFLNPHKGRGYARNFGNKMASADIIAPLDHDDYCRQNRVDVTLETFKKNPDADIFYASVTFRNDENGEKQVYEADEIDLNVLWEIGQWRICHCTSAYKKKAILAEPYSTDPNKDDWWLWWNFYTKGYKFCFSRINVAVYRCWTGYKDSQFKPGKQESIIEKKRKIMEPWFKENVWNEKVTA